MKPSGPPRLAAWLLTRFAPGPYAESMTGDLLEQFHRGRSSAWFWGQTIASVATAIAVDVWRNKLLVTWVVGMSMLVPYFYPLVFFRTRAYVVLDAWYPRLIDFLLRHDLDGLRHLAYRLHLFGLTTTVQYCVLILAIGGTLSRLHRQQRSLVLTLFALSQMVLCVPHLRFAIANWIDEPASAMWFLNLFWYSLFMFVWIPASVMIGGRIFRQRA